jgi:hypothetical protein
MELKNNERDTWFLYEHYLHGKSMIDNLENKPEEKRQSVKLKLSVSKKQIPARLEKSRTARPDAVLHLKQKSSCTSTIQANVQRPKYSTNGQAWPKLQIQKQIKPDHPYKFGARSPFFDKVQSVATLPKPDFAVAKPPQPNKTVALSRKFAYEPQLISNVQLKEVVL